MLVRESVSCTLIVMMKRYREANCCSLKPIGCTETPVISPVSTASAPDASVRTSYFPRPMNSDRTFSVSTCSTRRNWLRFSIGGIPMTRMFSGRNEPRPARA